MKQQVQSNYMRFIQTFMFMAILVPGAARADIDPTIKTDIDEFLIEHLRTIPVPGFSVVIARGNDIVFQQGYGLEVVNESSPMTSDSSIAIGSLTKSFTAVAVMQLVEQGKVELDQSIQIYLPWFETADRRAKDITVRHLLINASGIPSEDRWLYSRDISESAIEKGVRALRNNRLVRTPGESFQYSNENWSILGAMITEITGMPYSLYLQKHVLNPLEMTRSTTSLDRFEDMNVLYGHHPDVDSVTPAKPRFLASALPAGSELRVSAKDMGHYLLMLLNGGKYKREQLLMPESVEALHEPSIDFVVNMPDLGAIGQQASYGMGWIVMEMDNRTVVHHGGDAIVMGSWTLLDLEQGAAASILYGGPTLDPYRFPAKIWVVNNLLHLLNGKPITSAGLPVDTDPTANDYHLPQTLLDRYVGTYLSESGYRMQTKKSSDGQSLITQVKPGDIRHFGKLDFISESSAVSRNISGAAVINFIITPGQQVTGAVGGRVGGTWQKRDDTLLTNLRESGSADGSVAFLLPTNWTIEWTDNNFIAHHSTDTEIQIQGHMSGSAAAKLVEKLKYGLSDSKLIGDVQHRSESLGNFLWEQVMWGTQENDNVTHQLEAFTEAAGRTYQISATTRYGDLTRLAREVLNPILMDFEFEPQGPLEHEH